MPNNCAPTDGLQIVVDWGGLPRDICNDNKSEIATEECLDQQLFLKSATFRDPARSCSFSRIFSTGWHFIDPFYSRFARGHPFELLEHGFAKVFTDTVGNFGPRSCDT